MRRPEEETGPNLEPGHVHAESLPPDTLSGAQRLPHQLCLRRHQTHLGTQNALLVNEPVKQEHSHKRSRTARWARVGPRLRTSR